MLIKLGTCISCRIAPQNNLNLCLWHIACRFLFLHTFLLLLMLVLLEVQSRFTAITARGSLKDMFGSRKKKKSTLNTDDLQYSSPTFSESKFSYFQKHQSSKWKLWKWWPLRWQRRTSPLPLYPRALQLRSQSDHLSQKVEKSKAGQSTLNSYKTQFLCLFLKQYICFFLTSKKQLTLYCIYFMLTAHFCIIYISLNHFTEILIFSVTVESMSLQYGCWAKETHLNVTIFRNLT